LKKIKFLKSFLLFQILFFIFDCQATPPCSTLDTACNALGYLIPNLIRRNVSNSTTSSSFTFSGVNALSIQSANSVKLSWTAATSSNTAQSAIVYRVYSGTTSGSQNFTTALATSTAGATEITLTGLTANQNAYFVVRARDSAGNEDRNTEERAALLNGLIRYIPLDASSLTTGEKIGNGVVTPNGSPLLNGTDRRGGVNNAYTLNGSSHFQFPENTPIAMPIGNTPRTYCLWIKFNVLTASPVPISQGTGAGISCLQIYNNQTPSLFQQFTSAGSNATGPPLNNPTNWNFICMSYNSSNSIINFQSNEVGLQTVVPAAPASLNTFVNPIIGAYNSASPSLFVNGLITEVSVWNRALSPAELSAVYKN
jgi:hypothetical protein